MWTDDNVAALVLCHNEAVYPLLLNECRPIWNTREFSFVTSDDLVQIFISHLVGKSNVSVSWCGYDPDNYGTLDGWGKNREALERLKQLLQSGNGFLKNLEHITKALMYFNNFDTDIPLQVVNFCLLCGA